MPVQSNSNSLQFLTNSNSKQTGNSIFDSNKSFIFNDKAEVGDKISFAQLFKNTTDINQVDLLTPSNNSQIKNNSALMQLSNSKIIINDGKQLPLSELLVDDDADADLNEAKMLNELSELNEITELNQNSQDEELDAESFIDDLNIKEAYLIEIDTKTNNDLKNNIVGDANLPKDFSSNVSDETLNLLQKELKISNDDYKSDSSSNNLNETKNASSILGQNIQLNSKDIESINSLKNYNNSITIGSNESKINMQQSTESFISKAIDNSKSVAFNPKLSNIFNEIVDHKMIGQMNDQLLEADELSSKSAKEFLQMFKKMNEVDVSYNKSETKNSLFNNKDVIDNVAKLTSLNPENITANLDKNFVNLAHLQSATLTNEQTLINQTSMVNANIDVSEQAKINKLVSNPELNQALKLQENFTPGLAMRIQWMYKQAISSAEIKMDPPELGPLSVKIHHHNGETSVVFSVNHSATKDMVEENLAKLREMLNQQGINLGEATVEQQKQQSDQQSNSDKTVKHHQSQSSDNSTIEDTSTIAVTDKILDVYS